MDISRTCCFTGHRPETLYSGGETEEEIFALIWREVENAYLSGYRAFMCGACRGADFMFARAVSGLRESYPDARLECVLACRTQSAPWSDDDRAEYSQILDSADSVICLSEEYTKWCMQQRDRYMVDRSSLLIAAFNGASGGTAYTVKYAKMRKLRIINTLPESQSRSKPEDFGQTVLPL